MKKIMIISFILIILILFMTNNKEHLYISNSKIQGIGLFSDRIYNPNEKIFLGIKNDHTITELGSKINHCNMPNTYLQKDDDGWYLYSAYVINKDEELTVDYNYTPDFIDKPHVDWKC